MDTTLRRELSTVASRAQEGLDQLKMSLESKLMEAQSEILQSAKSYCDDGTARVAAAVDTFKIDQDRTNGELVSTQGLETKSEEIIERTNLLVQAAQRDLSNSMMTLEKELSQRLLDEIVKGDEHVNKLLTTELQQECYKLEKGVMETQEDLQSLGRAFDDATSATRTQVVSFRDGLEERIDGMFASMQRQTGEQFTLLSQKLTDRQDHSAAHDRELAELRSTCSSTTDSLQTQVSNLKAHVGAEVDRLQREVAKVDEEGAQRASRDRVVLQDEIAHIREAAFERIGDVERDSSRLFEQHAGKITELDGRLASCQSDMTQRQAHLQDALAALNRVANAARDDAIDARQRGTATEVMVTTKLAQMQDKELRHIQNGHQRIRKAFSCLSSGVIRMAQILGIFSDDSWRSSSDGDTCKGSDAVDLLLDWDASGMGLALKLEKGWLPHCSVKHASILETIGKKADQSTLKLLQMAVRDLDVRFGHIKGERDARRDVALMSARGDGPPAHTGSTTYSSSPRPTSAYGEREYAPAPPGPPYNAAPYGSDMDRRSVVPHAPPEGGRPSAPSPLFRRLGRPSEMS